ncbi:DUF6602 domain-containing protein [Bacillus cereus group sp. BfR-BA-01309]|uniref:DUF6602 domain-containing protein n=1 Tax=Bacillus cereus group sp. BfR-BA-01309 TaxID=2920286 RepID=UPI001F599A9A|nr:DUF6602 domain-containing protein [Bacillus cereus group sp. BfR-BA-01309]
MSKMYNFAYKTLENHVEQICTEVKLIKDFSHNGEKGREAEGILKGFLSKMLPQRVSVGTGFVMDNVDNHSNQLDIMIYDPHSIPPIFQGYENSIIHIDSLNVVIETKLTYRNSKDVVLTSQKSANKVKSISLGGFDNEEYIELEGVYSEYFPYSKEDLISRKPKQFPLCVLFAYTTDIQQKQTILDYLNDNKNFIEKDGELPFHPGLDIICILDLGLFAYRGGKYESFFDGDAGNDKLFSTLYHVINNHIQNKKREEKDFVSSWFNGLLRRNMEENI